MGGGAYAVSRANLGPAVSLVAAAALIVDYTLTVSVSIAAGVGAFTSAFPRFTSATVPLCLGILAVVTILNLRGLGETARAFLLPTMIFIVGLLAIIAVGLIHPLAVGSPQPGRSLLPTHALRDGVGAARAQGLLGRVQRPDRRRGHRQRRPTLQGAPGGTGQAHRDAARHHPRCDAARTRGARQDAGTSVPDPNQTVLSQIMAEAVGRHWAYYTVSLTITVVLALAANTSFGGLPVLTSLLARDNYLPHSLRAPRGPTGVRQRHLALAVLSGLLLVVVRGNTNAMIPLFAIGVFTGFTLAQTGLVVHWYRTRPPGWRRRATVNGVGAMVTAVSTLIFLVSKFVEGAWVVVLAISGVRLLLHPDPPLLRATRGGSGFGRCPVKPVDPSDTIVVVPVIGVSKLTRACDCRGPVARHQVIAVSVLLEEGRRASITRRRSVGSGTPGIPASSCTSCTTTTRRSCEPVTDFIDGLRERTDDQIVVLIPVVIPDQLRYRFLHNQIDVALSASLRRARTWWWPGSTRR